MRRAVEDIKRIVQIRSAKQACTSLLQKGSVGDDLFQRFTRAESEMEAELRDVVMEVCKRDQEPSSSRIAIPGEQLRMLKLTDCCQANALQPNWGTSIFQSANEINVNTQFLSRIDEIQAKTDSEKEWWEKRREAISSDFLKELDEEGEKKVPSDDGVLIDTSAPGSRPQSSSGGKKKKGKK